MLEEGHLLRIYISERDKKDGKPLYEWLVFKAKEHGLSGACVFRGIEGYGSHSRIHSNKIIDLSIDLPIVIELVDKLDKIESFLPIIDEAISEGLATLEKVQIRLYRKNK